MNNRKSLLCLLFSSLFQTMLVYHFKVFFLLHKFFLQFYHKPVGNNCFKIQILLTLFDGIKKPINFIELIKSSFFHAPFKFALGWTFFMFVLRFLNEKFYYLNNIFVEFWRWREGEILMKSFRSVGTLDIIKLNNSSNNKNIMCIYRKKIRQRRHKTWNCSKQQKKDEENCWEQKSQIRQNFMSNQIIHVMLSDEMNFHSWKHWKLFVVHRNSAS